MKIIKIKKYIGWFLYYFIGQWLPKSFFIIKPVGVFSKNFRQFCGKLMLIKCGDNVNIYNRATFSTRLILGNNSDIGYGANISGPCTIGNNVIMGPYVSIFTQNHRTERCDIAIKYQGNTEEKEVVIGDDCWIGYRAMIMPGVKIGKGVVVGAGAVVTKDIPDYAVVVGNPCRIVKYRNK